MNILQVIASMDPLSGGTSQGIRNSIPELARLGAYNEVVCLDASDASFLEKDKFPIAAIGPSKGVWQYSEALIPWLLKNLDRFDIVIANGLWLYPTYALRKALKMYAKDNPRKKIPKLYIMPHGMLDPYFQKADGRKIKALRNWLYWKLIESKVVNGANGVLFTCEAELLLAREPFRPYKPKGEFNVGYGVPPPPNFHQQMREAFENKCPEAKNRPYLLFLSRIHEKKGTDLLLSAYKKKVSDEGGYAPCLVIAGPGIDSEYGAGLHQLVASDAVLKTKVFFPGMLNGDAKWGAFYGCEAFVLPSHQENFGIAVVEALACKKPVLISNQVNIWKEIIDGDAGLVQSDTLAGTSKLLDEWYKLSDEDRHVKGANADKVYQGYFAVGPAAKKFIHALSNG